MKYLFNKIGIRLRINPRRAQELTMAGIIQRQRNERAVIARHSEQAAAVGKDAFRGNRTDPAGNKRPDSGTPVFTWKQEGRQLVCLEKVKQDIEAMGLRLTNANLFQKEGDHMFFLYLNFARERKSFELSPEADLIVSQLLARVYEHVHVYRNPDESATINPAHATDVPPQEVRNLRMDLEGKFRCTPR